jgi:hypothetical protein
VPPRHRVFVKLLPEGATLALGRLLKLFWDRYRCGCLAALCGRAKGGAPLAVGRAELLEVHWFFWFVFKMRSMILVHHKTRFFSIPSSRIMSNNGCGQLGAIQTRGTCWFYSILNGFILSEDGQKILYAKLKNFYKKLKPAEKSYFDDQFNAPCPMKNLTKTKEIYFWKFIDQYLCFMSGPRAASLKAGKSASLLGGMSLQGTLARKNQGGKGAFPQVEIAKILDHVGFAKDYYIKYTAQDIPKFHAGRKPQFVIVMQNKYHKTEYMHNIPTGFLDDPKYKLMCASLVIANTKANSSEMHKWHAVAGFVCNGHGYIYDSNQRKVFKCNWWNRSDFKKVVDEEVAEHYSFFRGGKVNVHAYSFAIFARKEFTKDIGTACLMKYHTKTPQGFERNLTDPNFGERLNSNKFNYMKPAYRIALKRKWAQTEHKPVVYLNKASYNSIYNSAENYDNGLNKVFALKNAGYKIRNENFDNFNKRLKAKFLVKKPSSPKVNPDRTYTFAEAKAFMNQWKNPGVRKVKYGLVWKGIPMAQRKVLMHYRNKGEWLANNAFENKAKPPIKRKPKPKTPSPSPRTKRTTQVKANFEKYWKAIQPENRQMIRNYITAYKSPSNALAKKPTPAIYTLENAKRNVNSLHTAKARMEFYKKGTVGKGLNPTNLAQLAKYIKATNQAARNVRAAKKSVAKK